MPRPRPKTKPRLLGHLDAPAKTSGAAAGALVRLEERWPALLVQCHGEGTDVRALVYWRGKRNPSRECRAALKSAGVEMSEESD